MFTLSNIVPSIVLKVSKIEFPTCSSKSLICSTFLGNPSMTTRECRFRKVVIILITTSLLTSSPRLRLFRTPVIWSGERLYLFFPMFRSSAPRLSWTQDGLGWEDRSDLFEPGPPEQKISYKLTELNFKIYRLLRKCKILAHYVIIEASAGTTNL